MLLVLTGNDPELLALGLQRPRICRASAATARRSSVAPQPLLARERVRYIGDPVAFVVAETLDQAKDAAELIEVEYEDAAGGRDARRGDRARRAGGVGRMPRQRRLPA